MVFFDFNAVRAPKGTSTSDANAEAESRTRTRTRLMAELLISNVRATARGPKLPTVVGNSSAGIALEAQERAAHAPTSVLCLGLSRSARGRDPAAHFDRWSS